MLNLISTLDIGFSLVAASMLLVCYLFFLKSNTKTMHARVFALLFMGAIIGLQIEHIAYFQGKAQPLESIFYRGLLFAVPPLFYFFSRYVLFTEYRSKLRSVFHFVPMLIGLLLPRPWAVPLAFLIGSGYCLWLTLLLYRLRNHRNRFEIEFFFLVLFTIFALCVLIVGFAASYVDDAYFYYFYANGISLAFVVVTAALIIYPDLLNELTEVVSLSYANSTLNHMDINEIKSRLQTLMANAEVFQDQNLNLSTLAELMNISGHQLSELINTQFGVSFSQYLREVRVERAKYLLVNEPKSSVLSIGMETGFKSQSNFYAAFKDITGQSPGNYRKSYG